jgi:hypothetical protein
VSALSVRATPAFALAGVALISACGGDRPSGPPLSLEGLAFDTLYVLGVAEGETWEAFGGIWDIEASPDGKLAILDVEEPAIHVFDATGGHVGSIDRTGLDPGALDRPSGIAWSGERELLVWDPGSSWISSFEVRDARVDFTNQWRAFAFGETGFCATEESAYLSYFQDGQVVHEVGEDDPVRSFGPAPDVVGAETLGPELQEIAIEELTPSGLLCTTRGVLDMSFIQAQIRLHDFDGGLIWGRDLESFTPVFVFTPDGMGLGRGFDQTNGSHLLRSVVPWGDSMVLVQHALRTQEVPDEGEIEVIESRLIRLDDGMEVERTRALPPILTAQGSRLYQVSTAPFPRVTVVEVSEP